MKYLLLILIASCASQVPKPEPTDTHYEVTGLSFQKQEEQEWCAVTATRTMISKSVTPLPTQCEIASKVHGEDCCSRRSIQCLQPIRIENAAPKYGVGIKLLNPSFDTVVEHIKRGQPVAIYHKNWAGTPSESGHAVIAFGSYVKPDGSTYIVVYDPYTHTKKYWSSNYVVGNLAWYSLAVLK